MYSSALAHLPNQRWPVRRRVSLDQG